MSAVRPGSPSTLPRPGVREAIRDLLTSSERFQALDPDTRREIAQGLVRIGSTAQALAAEVRSAAGAAPAPSDAALPRAAPLASAQGAGEAFSGVAAERVAGTTQQILNAVSFPRFVAELINGVFKALLDSNQQQIEGYVELIRNVSETVQAFADANIGADNARDWLVQRFPESYTTEVETGPFGDAGEGGERRLRVREDASAPSQSRVRTALGLGPRESVPSGDPERMIPAARLALARNRQQMLATLVMLGMQRIVVESGRLHAAMRFHIDTRSAAADDRGSRFDLRNQIQARASARLGPWGIDTRMQNTIGYVSTQRTQTTEEMNTDLDLSSSVELVFKTDYLPLERLAGGATQERIRVNTLNPNEEGRRATEERRARRGAQARDEAARRSGLDLSSPPATPIPASGDGGVAAEPASEGSPASTAGTPSPETGGGDAESPAAGGGGGETAVVGGDAETAATGGGGDEVPAAGTGGAETPAPPERAAPPATRSSAAA